MSFGRMPIASSMKTRSRRLEASEPGRLRSRRPTITSRFLLIFSNSSFSTFITPRHAFETAAQMVCLISDAISEELLQPLEPSYPRRLQSPARKGLLWPKVSPVASGSSATLIGRQASDLSSLPVLAGRPLLLNQVSPLSMHHLF